MNAILIGLLHDCNFCLSIDKDLILISFRYISILKSHLSNISSSFHLLVKKLKVREFGDGKKLPVRLLWVLITIYL